MYQPVVLFIGLRYIRGRTLDGFGCLVSWLSSIGIMIGVLSLITILSVMNGFEHELKKNVLNLMPQVLLISKKGSINLHDISLQDIKVKVNGVTRITPLTTADVVLQSKHDISVGVMLGINPNEQDPLTPFLINTRQKLLQPGKYNVIIGKKHAMLLGVKKGDYLRLMVPSIMQSTPIGLTPSQHIFNIIGTYSSNSEVDDYEILVNQQDASRMMRYPLNNITGLRLWLKEPLKIDKISQQKIPNNLIWKDWRERKGDLFQAVHMEKKMMELLLSLIIIVSSLNIITSLSLLIMQKQAEISILKSQGLSNYQIIILFMVYGGGIGFIGVLLGTLLGLLFSNYLNNFMPVINLFIDITDLPTFINVWQIMTIILVSMIIILIATFYPSWRAAAVQPAEALRYE